MEHAHFVILIPIATTVKQSVYPLKNEEQKYAGHYEN